MTRCSKKLCSGGFFVCLDNVKHPNRLGCFTVFAIRVPEMGLGQESLIS